MRIDMSKVWNGIMMADRVQLTSATHELTDRCQEYADKVFFKSSINEGIKRKVKSLEDERQANEKSRARIGDEMFYKVAYQIQQDMESCRVISDENKDKMRFNLNDADKAFWSQWDKASSYEGCECAVINWCNHYGLDVAGTFTLIDIMFAISGMRPNGNAVQILMTGAWIKGRTKTDVIRTLYAYFTQEYYDLGWVKPVIPEILVEVKEELEAKKAERKAAKKAEKEARRAAKKAEKADK